MGQCLSGSTSVQESNLESKSTSLKPESPASKKTIITITPDMDTQFKVALREKQSLFYYAETGDVNKFTELFDKNKQRTPSDKMNGTTLFHCGMVLKYYDFFIHLRFICL